MLVRSQVPNGDNWESDCGCVAADNSGDDCDDCAGVPYGDAEVYTYWYDEDSDGLGGTGSNEFCDATVPSGWVSNNDDNDDTIFCHSNMIDECDVCDGSGLFTFYYDNDDDGLGDPNDTLLACDDPGDEWVTNGDDSDDGCFYNTYTDWYADVDDDGLCDYNDLTVPELCDDYMGAGLPDGCEPDPEVTCSTNDTDACEVCGGGGVSEACGCLDTSSLNSDGCCDDIILGCDGMCDSGLVNDECGACDGDNSSCSDCAGVPNGDNVEDECDNCDNDSSNKSVEDSEGK